MAKNRGNRCEQRYRRMARNLEGFLESDSTHELTGESVRSVRSYRKQIAAKDLPIEIAQHRDLVYFVRAP